MTQFPSLDGFGPTRHTLRLYAQALGSLARTYVPAHSHWWHISLKVTPLGLITDNIPCGGGILTGQMDFHRACILLSASDGRSWSIPMDAGLSGSDMGEGVLAAAAEAGIAGEVDRSRFAGDEPGIYDPDAVRRFFTAIVRTQRVFTHHRAGLGIDAGPIQLWPHGFDLSMEWFGTRMESYKENDKTLELPAQLNLGFYPGDDDAGSYFYSSPWPFDSDKLLDRALPAGAVWHTEGWQGAMLPYAAVDDEDQVLDFARAIFDIASPLLMK